MKQNTTVSLKRNVTRSQPKLELKVNMAHDWHSVSVFITGVVTGHLLSHFESWLLSRRADRLQDRPPADKFTQDKDLPEDGSDSDDTGRDRPRSPTPSSTSSSSSSTSGYRGDDESERIRLVVRSARLLHGRQQEQGGILEPREREILDEARQLISGGDCVNDARLLLPPGSDSTVPYLEVLCEEDYTRTYKLPPSLILCDSANENLVAITNKLGDLTLDNYLHEYELTDIRWDVAKAQSILIGDMGVLPALITTSDELATLLLDINGKHQYLRLLSQYRQQLFQTYLLPQWQSDPDWRHLDPPPNATEDHYGLDTRPARVINNSNPERRSRQYGPPQRAAAPQTPAFTHPLATPNPFPVPPYHHPHWYESQLSHHSLHPPIDPLIVLLASRTPLPNPAPPQTGLGSPLLRGSRGAPSVVPHREYPTPSSTRQGPEASQPPPGWSGTGHYTSLGKISFTMDTHGSKRGKKKVKGKKGKKED